MTGILCSEKKEPVITEILHRQLRPLLINNNDNAKFVVFSLPNINLVEKTVYGSLISEDEIIPVKTSLPRLIFNLSLNHTKSDVKKLRSLLEIQDITVVNQANAFNQWTIMEMLSSGSKTKNYILPYSNFDKSDVYFDFSKFDSFILKPESGASLSKIIYGRRTDAGFDLYNWYGYEYCHIFDIQSAVNAVIQSGRWVLLKTPVLLTYGGKLFVVRGYLMKDFSGNWKVIHKATSPKKRRSYARLEKKMENSMLQIAKYLNCFMPDLGLCYIDFVVSLRGTPYFLNFGGWDNALLSRKQSSTVRYQLCKNIAEYAKLFLKSEGNDYVGKD